VSALQFRYPTERVAAGIRISGLAPHLLELELDGILDPGR
jgi:hypothetical protein